MVLRRFCASFWDKLIGGCIINWLIGAPIGFAKVAAVSSSCCCASICAGVLFFEVFCRRLRALPRVAT